VTEPAPRRDPGWLRIWWPLWLAVAALGFAIPETIALLAPGDGGTLSEMSREWLGISVEGTGGTVGWTVLTVALAAFVVWYAGHMRKWWWWERRRE
jgi:hypothetical protein